MNDPENEDDPDLDRLIAAVSNGDPVDWAAEVERRPDLASWIEPLRIAAAIGGPHLLSDSRSEAPSAAWGHLRIVEKIGEGGVAEVFRAFDPRLQTEVALKLLRPGIDSEERVYREGSRMARVRHANVLRIHGADRHEGRTGIWTEIIHGRTLEDLLQSQGPFAADEATRIGLELCRALAAVHGAGLVHRDVKTNNVMREQGGRIVLLDFGAGVERDRLQDLQLLEDGTPFVMAPEELRGERASPASDLYSLGVLLFRLVTKRFPVEARTYAELQEGHDRGERLSLRDLRPDLPAPFVAVVERAIEPDLERRFTSAGELERALMASLHGTLPVTSRRPRPQLVSILVLAAAVVLLAWVAWQGLSSRGPPAAARTSGSAPDHAGPTATAAPATLRSGEPGSETIPDPGPVIASIALMRERAGRTEVLAPGSPVRPGDGLSIQFRAEEALHVYVLDEDQDGEVFVLFPAPGVDLTNPLAPGRTHRLPGTRNGRNVSWQVTSTGGRETVMAIATRTPFGTLEREIASFPRASLERPVVYEKLTAEGVDSLRGIGGMRVEESASAPSRLSDVIRRLGAAKDPHTPWTWQIELENPR